MMRCSSVRQLYEDYVRGTLSQATLARIEEHLTECAACSREFELNEQIAQLMREGSEVAHPGGDYFESLAGRVLDGVRKPEDDPGRALEEARAAGSGRSVLRGLGVPPVWWSGAAAAAALLALGIFGNSGRDSKSISPALAASFVASAAARDAPRSMAALDPLSPTFASVAAAPAPTVVVSSNSTKHELLLGPGVETSPLSARSMAEVASLSPGGSASRKIPASADGGASGGDSKIQTVALKPAGEPGNALPQDLARQFDLIRQQMSEGGDKAFDAGLRDLAQKIDQQAGANSDLDGLPSVRQVRLFVDAQDALRSSRPREAWTLYRRILMVDETTPLAFRASLQLADLNYNEWADFQEAQRYYAQCQGAGAEKAFTKTEVDHIDRQLDRLRAHAANQWESLTWQHAVQRDGWPEALAALRKLTESPGASDLLPETARTIVDRMQASPPGAPSGIPMETAIAIYKLIEARAAAEPNAGVRGWLELALGDMQLSPFQEMQAASNHYKLAIEAAGDAGAGRLAAAKRDQLINRQLLDLVR